MVDAFLKTWRTKSANTSRYRKVADWNAKLSADAQDYRLSWDEKRSAFSFNPKSGIWQERAKTAGHGVLVRVQAHSKAVDNKQKPTPLAGGG